MALYINPLNHITISFVPLAIRKPEVVDLVAIQTVMLLLTQKSVISRVGPG